MKTRLSLPLLGYLAAITLIAIAVVRDFNLTSFIGGLFAAVVYRDALAYFHPTKDLTP